MDSCIFCKIVKGEIPSSVIYEDDNVKVILDIAPSAKGHAILLVKHHVADIFELDAELAGKIFAVVPKVAAAIKAELGCDGMNILQNNGVEAGQTVFHLHIHFIPRWKDDAVNIKWTPGNYADGEAAALAAAIKSRLD
ncbi:MAG: HIT family protein [Lachnospiraceae bacterium]|nr:HIT family protein [Lachnospiraceae bacterium]